VGEQQEGEPGMNIRRFFVTGMLLAGMLATAAVAQEALQEAVQAEGGEEDSDVWMNGSAEISFLTGYLWHGMLINDEPVAQPSLTLESFGLTFNIWANYDFTDNYSEEAPAFTEVDYAISYSFDLEPFAFSVGYALYNYPNYHYEEELEDGSTVRRSLSDTQLVYGYVEMPDLMVVPSLTLEYSVDGDDTLYCAFGLAYERDIAESLTVGLTGTLSWANAAYHRLQYDADENALGDATLGASLTWRPAEDFAATASLLYSYFVSDTISDAAEASDYDAPDALVAGLTLGFTF
jgi:hypothetical protein